MEVIERSYEIITRLLKSKNITDVERKLLYELLELTQGD